MAGGKDTRAKGPIVIEPQLRAPVRQRPPVSRRGPAASASAAALGSELPPTKRPRLGEPDDPDDDVRTCRLDNLQAPVTDAQVQPRCWACKLGEQGAKGRLVPCAGCGRVATAEASAGGDVQAAGVARAAQRAGIRAGCRPSAASLWHRQVTDEDRM